MYLFIDNSDDNKIILKLSLDNVWVQAEFDSSRYQLLSAIDKFLSEQKIVLNDVSGLAVLVGKGRFTATRIAVTVANTLAFALNIRVLGVGEFTTNIDKMILNSPPGRLVSAEYSGEANIGEKKKV